MTVPSEAILISGNEIACGIYFLVLNKEVIYMGQSQRISARIKSHRPDKTFDSAYAISAPYDNLNELENKWIAELNPPLNKREINISCTALAMKRMNTHFPESLVARLKNRAKRDGLTVAEVVRRAIIEFLTKQGV